MQCIDLIPESYHAYAKAKRILRHAGVLLAVLLVITLSGFAIVQRELAIEKAKLSLAKQKAHEIEALRQQITALQDQKKQFDMASATLRQLRGDDEVALSIAALDQALNEGVWLSHFLYKRVYPSDKLDSAEGSQGQSKLMQIGVQSANAESGDAVLPYSQLVIKGLATNHEALAEFFNAMPQQQGVSNVRFLNSSTSNEGPVQAVQFSAEALINKKGNPL